MILVLDLQKNWYNRSSPTDTIGESSHTTQPQFPLLLIVYIDGVHCPIHWISTDIIINCSPWFIQIFLCFTRHFLFQHPMQDAALHFVVRSHWQAVVQALLQILSLFLMTLRVWGVVVMHYVGRHSIGFCLMFISWLDWGYEFWWGRLQRLSASPITSYQRSVLLRWLITVAVDLDCLTEVACHFSTVQLLSSSFLHVILWKEVSMCSPYSSCRELCSISLDIKYLEISCPICFFSIYLLSYLFILVWTHGFMDICLTLGVIIR